MNFSEIKLWSRRLKDSIGKVIVGKEDEIELLLTALVASGHILLEDVPGTGKTLLAKSLARSLELSFQRIQFTPDLLPSDLTGIHYFDQKVGEFKFRPGPLFAGIILADEINRATPRTQSSLLECMEQRQISVDGITMPLDRPFMVLATQNPIDNQGTFPLPEAQMDRFMMKLKLGYPTSEEAVEVLRRTLSGQTVQQLPHISAREEILHIQQQYTQVKIHEDLLSYMVAVAEKSRQHPDAALGVSPRGTQAWLRAVQAYAAIQGREYVLPDDIQRLAVPVLAHRIVMRSRAQQQSEQAAALINEALSVVPVPSEAALEEARDV
ncbi:magnesium chelatase [Paenibacillus sp. CAA11]|uniref:AAA family ATPase n=1 Tax=Paenibacillus sp. CAA11 TaxID=1532905 RepID=UPI000D391257|nr:MoxR family ATPase [Paenibacillus sp. CAA11]AWB44144.1 magnesium chelatase [Paenibacillus sp. CAA11]